MYSAIHDDDVVMVITKALDDRTKNMKKLVLSTTKIKRYGTMKKKQSFKK